MRSLGSFSHLAPLRALTALQPPRGMPVAPQVIRVGGDFSGRLTIGGCSSYKLTTKATGS